jgi:hypothetical protein
MLIDVRIINDYVELHSKIEKFFEEAKIEKKHYFTAIGMSRPTFNRKLKDKTMLPHEMLALVDKINQLKV